MVVVVKWNLNRFTQMIQYVRNIYVRFYEKQQPNQKPP